MSFVLYFLSALRAPVFTFWSTKHTKYYTKFTKMILYEFPEIIFKQALRSCLKIKKWLPLCVRRAVFSLCPLCSAFTFCNSRVEKSNASSITFPPRQSVRAVFPHTAFLYSSLYAFTVCLCLSILLGLSVYTFLLISQMPADHTGDFSFGSCGYNICTASH